LYETIIAQFGPLVKDLMVAKVFHVLKWTLAELERTIAALLEEEAVREVGIGKVGSQLVSMHALRLGL
jgi:hypothetical protein